VTNAVATRAALGRLAGGADVWLLDEDEIERLGALWPPDRLLAPDELARYARSRHEGARRRFLGGRLLCRLALSAYVELEPREWRFVLGELGKPELDPNPLGLTFNVSHTEGLVACVVARRLPCGVDVEPAVGRPEARALESRVLAPTELRRLYEEPEPARAARFIEHWVLKEAYTKALGAGHTYPFRRISFELLPYTIAVDDPGLDPSGGALWQFALLRPRPSHLLAVALRRGPGQGPLRLRTFDLAAEVDGAGRPPGSAADAALPRHAA
jgi:4'-phosphopantetheinyl transferase